MFKRINLVFALVAITCFFTASVPSAFAYGGKSSRIPAFGTTHIGAGKPTLNQQPSPKAQAAKGKDLMDKSDCKICHSPDQKLIGPSFIDIATKYKGKAGITTKLAGKVIEGGSGVWGPIPMTPHPQISKEDAGLMVSYILSFKK